MKWWDWMPWSFFECWALVSFFILLFHHPQGASLNLFTFWTSEVAAISPSNLDSSLWFIQPSISHDVLSIKVKWAGWQYTGLTNSFPNFEPVHCSMPHSNFSTCMQLSQKAGKMVLYSHLFKNFPLFVVIHTVKGFSIVNEAEVDVFLEFSCFFLWSNRCWQFDFWLLCLF